MNSKILIVYSTKSGSTIGVARTILNTLTEQGVAAEVMTAGKVRSLKGYGAVILGSPIIMGKVRVDLADFMRRYQDQLRQLPLAMFLTCLRLTVDIDGRDPGFPVYIDTALQEKTKALREMNFMEKSHTLMHYCNPIMKQLAGTKPRAFAVFKGALDYSRLDGLSRVFMKFLSLFQTSVREGDYINHAVVSAWVKKFYLDLTR